MSQAIQRRHYLNAGATAIKLETRADGAPERIVGYAAVFYRDGDAGTEFEIWPAEAGYPRVVERIMPGAFDRALKEDDVRAQFNHDSNLLLGRSGAGTLRLSVDERGLRYEIDPPDTQYARDLISSIKRGDVSGSSFMFQERGRTKREEKAGDSATIILEQRDVKLYDVGPVTFPAYKGTEAGTRALGVDLAEIRAEVDERKQAAADADSVAIALALADSQEL